MIEGLAVVTVSTDEDEEALREFVTRHGLDPASRRGSAPPNGSAAAT